MSVTQIQELLSGYAAGELTPDEQAEVAAALAAAPQLQEELVQYQRVLVLLAVLADDEVRMSTSAERQLLRHLTIHWYLGRTVRFVEGVVGAYGRALLHYLGV